MPLPPLPLDAIVERASRLAARSTAEATSVVWLETVRGSASGGAGGRRAAVERHRSVAVRVRAGGRSGTARSDVGEVGELELAQRAALADAWLAEPSPDWPVAAALAEPVAAGAADPEIVGLAPAAADALVAAAGDRAALRLDWLEARVAVASSFHPVRAHRFTSATLAARAGAGPGAGFAARTAASLARLEPSALVELALGRAGTGATDASPAGRPLVLGGEAAIALLDAFARRALGGRARLERGGDWPFPLSAALTVDDDPLAGAAPALPFDLDGCARVRRRFVDAGRVAGAALDFELAARAGEGTTAHGLAAGDAWPQHLVVAAGSADEEELLVRAAGGVRVGALEALAIEPGEELPFRARARGLREIGAGGGLGAGLAPATWSGSLREVLSAIAECGGESATWTPDPSSFGAHRSPAWRLPSCGSFRPA